MSDIELQYLQSIRVAAIRHRGAHEPVLTDGTWGELIVWASPRRLLGRSLDVRGVGLCWDDPRYHDARERRYDVGVPIDAADVDQVDRPGFVVVTTPGRYLRATHVGPYDRLLDTYAEVIDGPLRYDGWTLLAQPIVELYRNSPSEVAPEDLRTDVYFPVIKP